MEDEEAQNTNHDDVVLVVEGPAIGEEKVPEAREVEEAAVQEDKEEKQEEREEEESVVIAGGDGVVIAGGDGDVELPSQTSAPAPPLPRLLGFDPRLVAMFFDMVSAEAESIPLNASTLLDLVRSAMELVEVKAVLSGADKKRIVLHVVRCVVMRTEFESPEVKQLCLTMLDRGVVSAAIDLAATASKGHLAINMPVFNKKGCAGGGCLVS